MAATVPIVDHRLFGRELEPGTLGVIERLTTRAVGIREGGYRDFDASAIGRRPSPRRSRRRNTPASQRLD